MYLNAYIYISMTTPLINCRLGLNTVQLLVLAIDL